MAETSPPKDVSAALLSVENRLAFNG
jgi:hypothetical protein